MKHVLMATYGTMKKGQRNHWRVEEYEFLGTAEIQGYAMVDIGHAPAAIPNRESSYSIIAEVYRISLKQLTEVIDIREGIHSGIYQRSTVMAEMIGVSPRAHDKGIRAGKRYPVEFYWMPFEVAIKYPGVRMVPKGIWKEHLEHIIVYGTLMSGCGNHGFLKGSTYCGKIRIKGFSMVSLGSFPAVTETGVSEDSVVGEVYEVDWNTIRRIDRLEGHPFFYQRKRIPIQLNVGGHNIKEAWIYLQDNPKGTSVSNGDWRSFIKEFSYE